MGNFNLTVFAEQIFPEAVQGSKQFSVLAHGILKSQGIIFSIHGADEDIYIQWYKYIYIYSGTIRIYIIYGTVTPGGAITPQKRTAQSWSRQRYLLKMIVQM